MIPIAVGRASARARVSYVGVQCRDRAEIQIENCIPTENVKMRARPDQWRTRDAMRATPVAGPDSRIFTLVYRRVFGRSLAFRHCHCMCAFN